MMLITLLRVLLLNMQRRIVICHYMAFLTISARKDYMAYIAKDGYFVDIAISLHLFGNLHKFMHERTILLSDDELMTALMEIYTSTSPIK